MPLEEMSHLRKAQAIHNLGDDPVGEFESVCAFWTIRLLIRLVAVPPAVSVRQLLQKLDSSLRPEAEKDGPDHLGWQMLNFLPALLLLPLPR